MKKTTNKKVASLLLAALMCAFLAACGGPDKQPAIDAHNKAGAAVNEVGDILNSDPETYAEYIEEMTPLVDMLNQCGEYLENNNDMEQDALDEWVTVCGDIEKWANEVKAELEN